jgi:hypothetical protein
LDQDPRTDGNLDQGQRPEIKAQVASKTIVVWFHDEHIFYAHDRRRKTWYRGGAPAGPCQKGDGASLMIADFVSSKYD